MFFHQLKYNFLNNIRQKEVIFWMLCFPIILATFFKLAFGNIYNDTEVFKEIPIAVVCSDSDDEVLKSVIDEMDLFSPQYTDRDSALELLKESEIVGIINSDEKLSLSVASSGIEATVIKSFIQQYEAQKNLITQTAVNHPEKMQNVIDALSEEINCINNISNDSNMDTFVQYFFNLLAMVALFASSSGVMAATSNQGNFSPIGARKSISPSRKYVSMTANFVAGYITQIICMMISITYMILVLKIDMGDKYGMIYLSGVITPLTGTALGFLIGSIGRASEETKLGLTIMVTMICCFFSGLMVMNMKVVIEDNIPILNQINPASQISDLFYCLMVYDDYSRYIEITAKLLIMAVIFTAGGILLTRRKKYASL